MKLILTGAAMVSQETVDFLSVCCSCPIMEIYGQSEMCGPISGTIITDTISNRGIRPWKHTEMKLVIAQNDRHLADAKILEESLPSGEVCVKGPTVFKSYFK